MENRTVFTAGCISGKPHSVYSEVHWWKTGNYLQRGALVENPTVFTAKCIGGKPGSFFQGTQLVVGRYLQRSVENRTVFTGGCVDRKADGIFCGVRTVGGKPNAISSRVCW